MESVKLKPQGNTITICNT